MKIIKRNGAEVPFDITKIITAVTKASDSVGGKARLSREQITDIAAAVTDQCQALNRAVSVEEVQDMVENQLMDIKAHDIARHYITYRYIQSLKRQTNTTDERILSLIECQNEEVKQENANKNPTVNSVQRDYMAGEISKDLTARLLLDPEIVKAHQEGLIHFHDSDYFAQHMHNCDLVNLDDMLQNGTVISGTYIEKPHSFSTACNIATQIIAQVASNQYGGQSISLTHLAPFVQISREKIRQEVLGEIEAMDSLTEYDVAVHSTDSGGTNAPWGELMSTAAKMRGAVGCICDSQIRDCMRIIKMGFPVFYAGIRPLDSQGRGLVVDYDVPVRCGDVLVNPGDMIYADFDGVVVIPREVEDRVFELAREKAERENVSRKELLEGKSLAEVYEKYGAL